MLNLLLVNLFGLLTPGPDFFYISRLAASHSKKNAICAAFGISLGCLVWAASAILGLAVLLTTYPSLQGMIMVLGGGYLAYLGVLMVKTNKNVEFETIEQEKSPKTSVGKEAVKGLLVNLSNAKAIIFFSSVMSFVLVNLTETWQIITALVLLTLEVFLYFSFIALIFSHKSVKRFYSQYSRYIDNFAGIFFLCFGGYLIYSGFSLGLGN
ncbi:LysE family transporter [Haemophilus haemoglobinophilus]|nr:LysE family transporter [Canicola haemoglobinophilus]